MSNHKNIMDKTYPKKTWKKLQELKVTAYRRELDEHLSKLSVKFDDWKNKTISTTERGRTLTMDGFRPVKDMERLTLANTTG
jgi:hypothetical protein